MGSVGPEGGMDKYGVVLDDEKIKSAAVGQKCPKCGRESEELEGKPWCPGCGFEPFEKKP